jgi:prepilin-type N-terminal cleavage/methylation domain-containing protein
VARRNAGFTLIELLAVLLIISILAWVLMVNIGGARDVIEEGNTELFIGKLELALGEYVDEFGDYPLSIFTPEQGTPPNNVNLGSECLYLALCGEGMIGEGEFDDRLENTDSDSLSRRVSGFATLRLFELVDDWGNPIAYLHHRNYDRQDVYSTLNIDAELLESVVRARRNAKTERFQNPRTYQLLSAGLDGEFGTEDDIGNFKD